MEEKRYSSGDIRQMFDISYETVRAWTAEFADHLSDSTNPGKGRSRYFSYEDLRVLALVSEMKAQRFVYADIHASLATGTRGEPPVPQSSLAESITVEQLARLQDRLMEIQKEHTVVVQKLNDDLTARDAQIELLKQQFGESQSKIDNLNREIGRLEARLDNDSGSPSDK